jgi:hypothetical protein
MRLFKTPSADRSNTLEAGAHQTNLTINLGGPTMALVLLLLGVIGLAAWVIGENTAERKNQEALQRQHELTLQREWTRQTAALTEAMANLQRQYRMTELKLDDWTVTAKRAGIVLPGDYTRGPQGNPDAASYNVNPPKKRK